MGTMSALSEEQFLALPHPPDGGHYELGEGELIAVSGARFFHELVKSKIHELLVLWNAQSGAGRVFGTSMFKLAEGTLRQPDVAFVDTGRFANAPDELMAFPPNLAVEVISGSEPAEQSERKVHQYLRAGVAEVWQIYPASRVVHVRTPGVVRELHPEQLLETPVLPGFSARTGEFFE
jgi:Uma2 family endonuclease